LDVGVLEPQTFMNESGTSLAAALRKLPVEDPAHELLIVLDDADLPFGRLRLRAEGGDGGHRGRADPMERRGGGGPPRAHGLLLFFDDADLPFGRLRLRAEGGDGGHRGLADAIERLGRRDLPRLRFGIGRPSLPMDTSDFVLARFTKEEEVALRGHLDRAAEAVETFLTTGIEEAMNRFNAARFSAQPG